MIDRDELIEQALLKSRGVLHVPSPQARWHTEEAIGAALPVIVKAVTDELRKLHEAVEVEPSDTICAECSFQLPNGRYFGKIVEHPCPTLALCDEIDAAAGVTR